MIKLPFTKYPSFGRDDSEYAYACGRIKALETRLLDRVRFERLATAKDLGEVLKLLQDTDYSRYLNELHSPGDYEILLRREFERVLNTVSELALDSQLLKDLKIPYDFLNVKVVVKGLIFEKDFSSSLSKFSYYPGSVLKYVFETGKFELVDPFIAKAFENAISSYYERKEVFRIDAAVDKVMYEYLALSSNFEFIRVFYGVKADFTNLMLYLRLERLGRINQLRVFLVDGGYLPLHLFTKVPDFQTLLNEIRQTVYHDVLASGYQYFLRTGSFIRLERDIFTYLNELIRRGSMRDLGVEPLIAYYFRKKNELNLLRMIMVSKINDLPKEQILERIPEVI
ncbi:MAG: V-type ATPase subunit [Candidatus Hydrothermia bacterium]